MAKEIIIDGVDVNECKYFCKFTTICRNENIGRVVRPSCKNVVDCYFKQLKRAEQKLERIEDRVQDLDNYSEKNVEIMEDILTIIQGE